MEIEYDRVLDFCNEVREDLDRSPIDRLRKGFTSTAFECPVANTINYGCRNRVEVGGSIDLWRAGQDGWPERTYQTQFPTYVKEFIKCFDGGKLPELEGRGWYGD